MNRPDIEILLSENERLEHSSTSKGNQVKWYKNNCYYKADSFGYEGLAEWVVSGFCESITDFYYVPYEFCLIDEEGHKQNGCYSESFLKENESFVSIAHILELKYLDYSQYMKNGFKESFRFVCDEIMEVAGVDISEYLAQNLYLDAIILNEDRHFNNLGVVKGDGYYKIAPVFDNGFSLLSDLKLYDPMESLEKNMKLVKAKPFSKNFGKQVTELNEMGFAPLIIDDNRTMIILDSMKNDNYPEEYMVRCRAVIKKRLRELEGKAWQKKQ